MRLNKVAGIAASTFFSGALVLGLSTTATAAPDFGSASLGSQSIGCDETVTEVSALPTYAEGQTGWSAPGTADGQDEKAATITADGAKFAGNSGTQAISLYKPADGVDLSTLTAKDFGYTFKAIDGPEVPSLQVLVTDAAESKWSDPGESGFASLVWYPSADILASANADGWVTVTGEQLAASDQWRITGDNFETRRTFADIKTANPEAKVNHVGMQLTKSGTASTALVSDFVYKGCTTTFTTPPAVEDAGPLASLTDFFGNLS